MENKYLYKNKKYKQKVNPEQYGPEAGEGVKNWKKILVNIFTVLLIIGACVVFVTAVF